ncbi:MAG: hypothetical protein OEO19_19635 [Gammaproteobacteria bacterium]|nr:hypothetical protein [Gammaproteobacteria bacterium]MDH3449726.1 hypothetical protein [Gammaproteobacteria bacterium]
MRGKSRQVLFSSLCFILGVASGPGPKASDGDSGYVCEQGGATRHIEVVRESGYACRVRYTKASGATFPWSARNDADYCGPRALGLVDKLGSLGWACDKAVGVRSILLSQMERYGRHIKILGNIGKKCFFYPGEAQYGNICGDSADEAVTVYTCESGADGWDQHLAVFVETESEPLILEVGASGSRQLTGYYIDRDRIVIETEKVDPVESSGVTLYPAEQSSIACRSATATGWELVEQ